MNIPEKIYSVGGAGKAIAFELLESEWILREILKPRPNPESLTVTIIDTAEEEENTDRERIRERREQISELKSELREGASGRPGDISIEYKQVTQNIQLNDQNDLIGDAAVPRIAAGNGMEEDNWWVKNKHINENLDFATGVVRKRGLGKAIYYKAYAEDDELSTFIDLPDKGKVAVLAGLGGGTGSGLIIDLARHLKKKQRTAEITLFGILPNHTEGMRESANAFAALSELEYLSLTGESVFKDCILLPIDPTGFDGKGGNKIQNTQLLQEFDEAIIYLLSAYYNTVGSEDPFADSPSYAPFTIGIPQILRYNVEAINSARTALRDILNAKQEAVQVEREIYTQIERFLDTHYDAPEGDGLRDLDQADISERLDHVETLRSFELFNELEYESVSIFNEIIADAGNESDDIGEQVDIISGSLRAVNTTGAQAGTFVDAIDEHLAEVLEADLQTIAQRKRLLVKKQSIDDSRVRDGIEYLVHSGDGSGNPGVKLNRLETQLDDITNQQSRLESELQECIEEIETLQEEQSDEIQREVTNWEREVEPLVRQLDQIDVGAVDQLLTALRRSVEQFRSEVVNAPEEDAVDQVPTQEILGIVDDIEDELSRANVGFGERRSQIEMSLLALKEARKAFMTMNMEEGTIEKLTPWEGKTEKAKDEAHRNYRVQKNKLNDQGLFSLGPPGSTFTAEVEYVDSGIVSELEERQRELSNQVVDELAQRLEDFGEEHRRDIQSEIEHGPDISRLADISQEAFQAEIGGTDQVRDRKAEIESQLSDLESTHDIYQATTTLFKDLSQRRQAYAEHLSEFHRQRNEYDSEPTRPVATERDDSVYVKTIKPNDIFRATGDADISESELFQSVEETQRVYSTLEGLIENVFNEQYSGIKKRSFSKGTKRYDEIKIRIGVLSRAVDQIDPNVLDFEDRFNSAFDLGASGKRIENPYTSWQHDIGDSWDIGLSTFIDGVFLDNLRKMVQADGYRSGYQQRQSALGRDIYIHHSYGLEDGHYVRRDDVLNMENTDEVGFFLRDEQSIVDDLLNHHIDVIPIDETFEEGESVTIETDDEEKRAFEYQEEER